MEQTLRKLLAETTDEKGRSVYSHLSEVFSYVLQNNPENLYATFEQISTFVKSNSFNYQEPQEDTKVNNLPPRTTPISLYLSKCSSLLAPYKQQTSQGFWVETAPPALGKFPNLVEDSDMLRWIGIGLGEQECYRLQMSLKQLMRRSGAKELRFWGKIYATQRDYYVAEGLIEGAGKEDVERPHDFEPRGEGINKLTYWVTHSPLEDWVELPDATPQQIKASRSIKKMLTGNLNAQVHSYPIFPGKERHLLRAQIARISCATVLIPKGLYRTNEDEPNELEAEEEPAAPAPEELQSEESWVHFHPYILGAGRATHAEPESVPEGEDPEEVKAKIQEEDPPVERLRAITEDEPISETEKLWRLKIYGDNQVYAMKPPAEGNISYSVGAWQNVKWPGAYTVFKGEKWTNIYLGWGIKSGGSAFEPVGPPKILDDPEDPAEQPEPTPLEAPDEVESDTDKESEEDED